MEYLIHLCQINIKRMMFYRFSFLATALIAATSYGMNIIFIDSIYRHTNAIGGWSKESLFFLFFIVLMSTLISDIFDSSVMKFFDKLYHGEADVLFMKPINLKLYMFFGWQKYDNLIPILFCSGLGLYYFFSQFQESGILTLFGFFLSFWIGVACSVLFMAIFSLITFFVKRKVPADFISYEVNKLAILPTGAYPKNGLYILIMLVPNIFCSAIPSALLLKNEMKLLIYQIVGLFLFTFLFNFMYKKAIQKYDGLGG